MLAIMIAILSCNRMIKGINVTHEKKAHIFIENEDLIKKFAICKGYSFQIISNLHDGNNMLHVFTITK